MISSGDVEFVLVYFVLFLVLCLILWVGVRRLWKYAAQRVEEDRRQWEETEEQVCFFMGIILILFLIYSVRNAFYL